MSYNFSLFCFHRAVPVKITEEIYRNAPGKIENYEPGRSSIAEKETKEVRTQNNRKL